MKKLLVTGSTFPRWANDTEPRFILDYAKAMTKYYDVTVLVPGAVGAKEEEELEGVHVIRYHYFPIHKFETLCYPGAIVPRIKQKKVRILLVPFLLLSLHHQLKKRSKEFDVVHAHWLIPQGIMQMSVKDTPYIVTGHGGDVTSLNKGILKSMKLKCLERAKAITVVSDALQDYVKQLYPNQKTSIIPMGCDVSRFSSEHRKENFFGQGDRKVVLFVGRLAEKKGVTYLIDAMKKVDNAVLVIVGKGDLEPGLRQQAKALGDKVVFAGPKTHDELPEIYASADVFVAPSVTAADGDKEGFGLVILEAMASGVPVVASRSGGIVDIVKDEENGLLCDEKDVEKLSVNISRVLEDEALSAKLKTAAGHAVEQYSYDNISKRYNDILSGIL